jgi:hypothetical protein
MFKDPFLFICILYGCIYDEVLNDKKISKKSFNRAKDIKAKLIKTIANDLRLKEIQKIRIIDLGFNLIDLLKEKSTAIKTKKTNFVLYDRELCFAALMRTILPKQ